MNILYLPLCLLLQTAATASPDITTQSPLGSLMDLIVIAMAGSFGGFIYSLQNGVLSLPHREGEHGVNLGFFANLLFGIAGAIIIFLIVPGSFNFDFHNSFSTDFIKSIATAVLGGYGGLALINNVFSKTLNTEIKQAIEQTVQEQQQVDEQVFQVAEQFFSGNTTNLDERNLSETLKKASPTAKVVLQNMARDVRTQNWRDNKTQMERAIPVFKALETTDRGDTHGLSAQLAFALKERATPDYQGALDNLNKAINLRNKENTTGFGFYEFNRAVCLINLDQEFKNRKMTEPNVQSQIIADLRNAFNDPQVAERLKKSNDEERAKNKPGDKDIVAIRSWLRINGVAPETVNPYMKWIE